MSIFNHKGQCLAEYALIFSLILAALLTMQVYVKRGLQGRYKDATDEIVSALRETKGETSVSLQYEPYYNESEMTATMGTAARPNREVHEEFLGGSGKTTIDFTTTREGYQKLLPARQ